RPAPSRWAIGPAMMKPRASMATTLVIPRPTNGSTRRSVAAANPAGSPSKGVMSLNPTPGVGTSGTSRMSAARSLGSPGAGRSAVAAVAGALAVGRDEPLPPALLVPALVELALLRPDDLGAGPAGLARSRGLGLRPLGGDARTRGASSHESSSAASVSTAEA